MPSGFSNARSPFNSPSSGNLSPNSLAFSEMCAKELRELTSLFKKATSLMRSAFLFLSSITFSASLIEKLFCRARKRRRNDSPNDTVKKSLIYITHLFYGPEPGAPRPPVSDNFFVGGNERLFVQGLYPGEF